MIISRIQIVLLHVHLPHSMMKLTIVEKEVEMRRTQELLNERIRQMEAMLDQFHRVNRLLEQVQILELTNGK